MEQEGEPEDKLSQTITLSKSELFGEDSGALDTDVDQSADISQQENVDPDKNLETQKTNEMEESSNKVDLNSTEERKNIEETSDSHLVEVNEETTVTEHTAEVELHTEIAAAETKEHPKNETEEKDVDEQQRQDVASDRDTPARFVRSDTIVLDTTKGNDNANEEIKSDIAKETNLDESESMGGSSGVNGSTDLKVKAEENINNDHNGMGGYEVNQSGEEKSFGSETTVDEIMTSAELQSEEQSGSGGLISSKNLGSNIIASARQSLKSRVEKAILMGRGHDEHSSKKIPENKSDDVEQTSESNVNNESEIGLGNSNVEDKSNHDDPGNGYSEIEIKEMTQDEVSKTSTEEYFPDSLEGSPDVTLPSNVTHTLENPLEKISDKPTGNEPGEKIQERERSAKSQRTPKVKQGKIIYYS